MFTAKKYIHFLIILFLIGLFSCKNTFDEMREAKIDITTELGLKVVDASLSLTDTLEINVKDTSNSLIKIYPGPDGIFKLQMSREIFNINLDSILPGYQDSVFAINKEIPYGDASYYSKGDIEFGFSLNSLLKGKSIDSLKLNNGNINIAFNIYDHFYSKFSIVFPNISNEKDESVQIVDFIPTESNNSISINLQNKKIKIENKNGRDYMVVKIKYYIETLDNNNSIKPSIDIELKDLDIEYAYGNFGNDTIKDFNRFAGLFDTGPVLFEGQDVTFDFKEPKIELNILNSFGIPIGFDIDTFGVIHRNKVYEKISGIQSYIEIAAPSTSNQNDFVPTILALAPNSNIDLLLSKFPETLLFGGNLLLNPNQTNAKNYIRDEDKLIANLNIDVPFTLNISTINLTDTVNVDFDSLRNDNITPEFIRLKTDITNSFPFEFYIQIYFADSNFEIIDSLFDAPMHLEGSPELNIPAVTNTIVVDRSDREIQNLFNSKHLLINAFFSTADSEKGIDVSVHKDHKLDVSITLFTKLNIQTGNESN